MGIEFDKIPDREKAERLKKEYQQNLMEQSNDKRLQENLNLEYRYVRMWDFMNGTDISVSFGWKRKGDEIVYAVALQSKKDNFSRKDARKVINRRFYVGHTHSFTFVSKTAIRDMGPILAAHYNSLRELEGVVSVPKYLRHIPIIIGE